MLAFSQAGKNEKWEAYTRESANFFPIGQLVNIPGFVGRWYSYSPAIITAKQSQTLVKEKAWLCPSKILFTKQVFMEPPMAVRG